MAFGLAGTGNLISRIILIISAAVILGVSVWLNNEFNYILEVCSAVIEDCSIGGLPIGVRYGIFVGIFGLVAALIGLVPTFVGSTAVWIAALIFDGLAAIFYLAGGIDVAVAYHQDGGESDFCGGPNSDDPNHLCATIESRTRVDIAFLFIGFVVSLISIALLFVHRRAAAKRYVGKGEDL